MLWEGSNQKVSHMCHSAKKVESAPDRMKNETTKNGVEGSRWGKKGDLRCWHYNRRLWPSRFRRRLITNFSHDSIQPAPILNVCGGRRQHVGLTGKCFTCSVFSKVICIAAVGRSTIPALVDLIVVGWRGGWALRWLLWFGWDGDGAGREESRDGQELGEMHCGFLEIGQLLWLIERMSQCACQMTRLFALNRLDQNEGKGKLESLYNTSRVS